MSDSANPATKRAEFSVFFSNNNVNNAPDKKNAPTETGYASES